MPISNNKLEELEKEYFDQLYDTLGGDSQRMINWLNTKDEIKQDWISKFNRLDKQRQTGELARGAERVFYSLLAGRGWTPNSAPIGADMFFQNHNAYIHIEIKTARVDNGSDFKGLVPVSKNQTSYKATASNRGTTIATTPNLPTYYHNNGLPCLTYAIQLIYKHSTLETLAVLLIAIPNGQLYSVYGNSIANSGKSKDESFRYSYRNNPTFKTLKGQPKRVRFLFYNNNSPLTKEQITKRNDIT